MATEISKSHLRKLLIEDPILKTFMGDLLATFNDHRQFDTFRMFCIPNIHALPAEPLKDAKSYESIEQSVDELIESHSVEELLHGCIAIAYRILDPNVETNPVHYKFFELKESGIVHAYRLVMKN